MLPSLLSDGYFLSMRHLVKFPDCNATSNLFGGQALAWIDEGAALYAGCQMETSSLVTVKIGEVVFKHPVPLGHVFTVYCKTLKEGTTSLTVRVVATRREFSGRTEEPVIETEAVFVSIGPDGKSKPWGRSIPYKRPEDSPATGWAMHKHNHLVLGLFQPGETLSISQVSQRLSAYYNEFPALADGIGPTNTSTEIYRILQSLSATGALHRGG